MQKATDGEHDASPVLAVRDVSYAFGARRALDHVSFELMPGRFMALLGPNGAGKTTLFSLITRLFDTREGRIEIAGRDLKRDGSSALAPLGVVFQQQTLDLDLTVRQNLGYFAALRGLGRREARERMTRALDALSMGERIDEKVRSLNGGHRRRVEIARALLHGPSLLLLDEPTVGLDVAAREAMVSHVHRLAAEEGVAVLWATHLIDEIDASDDLIVLHQGSIRAQGRASEVIRSHGAEDVGAVFAMLTQDGTETEAVS
ncbi:MAG: ABC transporter ATP-binding protein [Dichotomicrobium sp.]